MQFANLENNSKGHYVDLNFSQHVCHSIQRTTCPSAKKKDRLCPRSLGRELRLRGCETHGAGTNHFKPSYAKFNKKISALHEIMS